MVGTRHAVSDNKSKSGLGMPSPYIPEREQIQDRKAGLKRETENCGRCTQRPYHSPLPAREGEITAEQVATSAVHHTPSHTGEDTGRGPIINPLTKSRFTPCQHEGNIALCPVTFFLLGRYPKRILIYKINKNHLHCPIFIE